MKSKREKVSAKLRRQIEWAEGISDKDIHLMLLDGKSKTSCGCDVIGEDVCPHGNMGVLQLLLLQLSKRELDELKKAAEDEAKNN